MTTAEEILSKHIEWFTSWDIIIEAMEEYAQQQCQKRDELIKAQDEYIKLLVEELDEVVVLMSVHGWKSHRYEQGKQSRDKIEQLKKETQ
jgi:hypothetical protein